MNGYARKFALASAFSLALMTGAKSLAAPAPSHDILEARQESQIITTYALNRHLEGHEFEVTVDAGVATLRGRSEIVTTVEQARSGTVHQRGNRIRSGEYL